MQKEIMGVNQLGIMVAYVAAIEGGNVHLAQEIVRKAEKDGITIKSFETEDKKN